ncbi:MAG TPA: hypothetical protein VEM58_15220 [Streptosporangiaceae bacterium]|nr:hypothetical protein [Streptosporangiaceae bacterium]
MIAKDFPAPARKILRDHGQTRAQAGADQAGPTRLGRRAASPAGDTAAVVRDRR